MSKAYEGIMKTAFIALLLTSIAAAEPRMWTSADGRTIEAEYLGRGPDGSSLVLQRKDTGSRVTVPISALSAEDQTHASTLGTTIATEEKSKADPKKQKAEISAELRTLAAAFPPPKISQTKYEWVSGAQHPEYTSLQASMARELSSILSGDVAMNCRSLRIKAQRERERLSGLMSARNNTQEGNARGYAASLCVYWIDSQILPHLAKIEAEANKPAAVVAAN